MIVERLQGLPACALSTHTARLSTRNAPAWPWPRVDILTELEANKTPAMSGWGIKYGPDAVTVEFFITDTANTKVNAQLLIADLSVASGVRNPCRPQPVSSCVDASSLRFRARVLRLLQPPLRTRGRAYTKRQAPESDFCLVCVDNPDPNDLLKPRIYNISIMGSHHTGRLL